MTVRDLSDEEAKHLPAGAEHYKAYVGPPKDYDLIGALQFRLLCALGLRENHRVLDFGCGSLRAGRLLIPYLAPTHYHGLEPQRWLIDDAIARQLGGDLVRIKQPRFHAFDDFRAERCGTDFDFIVAHSIFTHTGRDIFSTALDGFRKALAPRGLAIFTVRLRDPGNGDDQRELSGWTYPGPVFYEAATVDRLIATAGLTGRTLPTYHPRQVWYAAARDGARLPPPALDLLLRIGTIDAPT